MVFAKNLQPYLSAINSFYTDIGLEPCALGPLVANGRNALALRQTPLLEARDSRLALHASVALSCVDEAARLARCSPDFVCRARPTLPLLRKLRPLLATAIGFNLAIAPAQPMPP